jgi:hypothetical protein
MTAACFVRRVVYPIHKWELGKYEPKVIFRADRAKLDVEAG